MLEKHCEDDARHMARSPSDAALTSVAEVVGKMTSFLESIGDVDATLEQMCDNLVDAVPGADAAGVTVIRRGRPVTIVVTDGCVRAVDRAQYDADEGPCLEAAATRTPVRVTSGVAAQRYPEFWTRNADTGMRSFLSTPVSVGDERYGALNLYSRSDHGFEYADADTSTICVTVVSRCSRSPGESTTPNVRWTVFERRSSHARSSISARASSWSSSTSRTIRLSH